MFVKSSNIPDILHAITSLQPVSGEAVMLLFSENDVPDIPALITALNNKNITFFGGVFPGIIYRDQQKASGCIINKFKALMGPFCVSGIASAQPSGFPLLESTAHLDKSTAIVLLDGLASNIYHFLENLNDLLGEHCRFIGAGAGSISLRQRPCVFNQEGFQQDAAVVCVIDKQVQLGVRHGWQQLDGPLVATETKGNTIIQLNWRPAIEVYNRIVEKDCGIALHPDNFASIAQSYPFGILREKEDDIVRDPLAIGENGAIICIGEVPTNTVLHVLKGYPATLLEATQKAMSDSTGNKLAPVEASSTFIVDCITRTLFLNDEFATELNIVRNGLMIETAEQEPYGLLSLGEISSYGEGLLELFNKTIVIGTFY
jgi:hypothetical protein